MLHITLAPIDVGRADEAEDSILNDCVGTWFTNDVRQKSLKTRLDVFYTCVSCLHCKRLPQTLEKTPMWPSCTRSKHFRWRKKKEKLHFPETAQHERGAETRWWILSLNLDLIWVKYFTASFQPPLNSIQINFKHKKYAKQFLTIKQ